MNEPVVWMRKRLGIGLAVVSLLATTGCADDQPRSSVQLGADYPVYETVESLVDAADLIVEGTENSSRTDLVVPDDPEGGDEDDGIVTTMTELSVSSVLMGDLEEGSTIEVSQIGGTYEDIDYVYEGGSFIEDAEGASVVVLLEELEDGTRAPLNPEQGVLLIDDDGTLLQLNSEATSSLPDDLTIERLTQVIEAQ